MVEKVWDCPEVFRIPVPLPQNPLRELNAYVIRTPGANLVIDTGFCREECRAALWSGLEALGLEWSRTALFLTHLHSDHTGLVWDFVDRGIPVYMGRGELDYCASFRSGDSLFPLSRTFLLEGFPKEELERQPAGNQAKLYAPRPGYPTLPVEDGQPLPFPGAQILALQTPGHTPGHTVLYLPEEQLLFTGDHILFDITPNISIWPNIPYSLSDYLASLRKTRTLPIRAAFPAHRAAGEDVYRRIDRLIEHHAQRLEEIAQAASAQPGSTAYDLAGRIRWSARGLPWRDFPPHQRWFAMGETAAHLYELVRTGRLLRREADGLARYFPAEQVSHLA